MRMGVLFVIEWLTRGTVAGLSLASTRREIEAKLGALPLRESLVRYGDLEVSYWERGDLDARPNYLMVDLFDDHQARWREEMRWLDPSNRPLAEAICSLRTEVISGALAE